jgi:cell division protein FtsI/penicillin-binding protein 2
LRGVERLSHLLKELQESNRAALQNGEFDKEAIPGHDIMTTIDADLQQYGRSL